MYNVLEVSYEMQLSTCSPRCCRIKNHGLALDSVLRVSTSEVGGEYAAKVFSSSAGVLADCKIFRDVGRTKPCRHMTSLRLKLMIAVIFEEAKTSA